MGVVGILRVVPPAFVLKGFGEAMLGSGVDVQHSCFDYLGPVAGLRKQ